MHYKQLISSPNYPNDYDNNGKIEYSFRSRNGGRVTAVFTEFKTVDSGDSITVYDWYDRENPIDVLYGDQKGRTFTFEYGFYFVFTTDDTGAASGWRLEFISGMFLCFDSNV